MSRTTLAALAVVVGVGLALTTGANAATHSSRGPHWAITDLGTFGPRWTSSTATAISERTQQEWTGVFEGADACVSPVLPLTEAARQPHLAARHTYLEQDGVVQPAPAPRFSRTPAALGSPPSLPGQHSREALQAWGVEDVDRLITDGVVTQA